MLESIDENDVPSPLRSALSLVLKEYGQKTKYFSGRISWKCIQPGIFRRKNLMRAGKGLPVEVALADDTIGENKEIPVNLPR